MNRQIPINSYFDVFEQLVCNFLYNAVYLFSVLQIKYKRLVKPVEHPLIRDRTDEHKIELFYEGDAVQLEFPTFQQGQGQRQGIKEMTKLLRFLQNKHGDVRMSNDSLIVYTNSRAQGVQDKVILRNGDKINILEPDKGDIFDYKRTKCGSFLSFEMVLEDLTTHPIQLNDGLNNYYIVGNVIDRTFIAYYSKKYLKLSEAPQKYTLHIVDGDANFFTITQDETIWFEESTLSTFEKSGAKDVKES
jgi:hypothetical protein